MGEYDYLNCRTLYNYYYSNVMSYSPLGMNKS